MANDPFADFDREFHPAPAFTPGLDALPDGVYAFRVETVEKGETLKQRTPILRLVLAVDGFGVVERGYPLADQAAADRCGYDLIRLGFGTEKNSFSALANAAVARGVGVRFKGAKSSREDQGGVLRHNLQILGLLKGGDTVAPAPPPAPAKAAAPPPRVGFDPVEPPARQGKAFADADIPFGIVPWLFALATLGWLVA